jgi:hypothetical protein
MNPTNPYAFQNPIQNPTDPYVVANAENPTVLDKQCKIYVPWVTDPSETGGRERGYWHRPHTVDFANNADLVQQIERLVPPERWSQVFINTEDMMPEFQDVELDENGGAIDEDLERVCFQWSSFCYIQIWWQSVHGHGRVELACLASLGGPILHRVRGPETDPVEDSGKTPSASRRLGAAGEH